MKKITFTKEIRKEEGLNFVNQRQVVIQDFVDDLNLRRKGTKYAPVTWTKVNGVLSHVKDIWELRAFHKVCEDSFNFGATFWSKLKVK